MFPKPQDQLFLDDPLVQPSLNIYDLQIDVGFGIRFWNAIGPMQRGEKKKAMQGLGLKSKLEGNCWGLLDVWKGFSQRIDMLFNL